MRDPKERIFSIGKFDKSVTQQNFKSECDINKIMAKYQKNGVLMINNREALYGDFSNVPDYMESLNIVRKAHEQFDVLPASLRNRFENDPQKFLAWAGEPANESELIELGLRPKPMAPGAAGAASAGSPSAEAPAAEGGAQVAQN